MAELKMNAGQQAAVDAILDGRNVFLTGEGGTGKSVALRKAVNTLRHRGRKTVICAPTGIAAQLIGGATIHSAFRFDTVPKVASELDKLEPSKVISEADTVVIDEIGMVRRDLMDAIAIVVKKENARRKAGDSRGDLQIVVVGDFSQLPPVVTNKDRPALVAHYGEDCAHSGFYAFESDGWRALGFETRMLTEPMRQADPTFVRMLNLARIGDATCLPYFNRLCRGQAPDNAVSLVSTNKDADATNQGRLDRLPGEARIFEGSASGSFPERDMAAPKDLRLKVGARVICLTNDKQAGYVNGSTGTVKEFDTADVEGNACISVELDGGGTTLVKPHIWENIEYRVVDKDGKKTLEQKVIGKYRQYPLKLCWSVTYHKSQGQTLDAIAVNPRSFAAGQLYVGLSRATSAAGIWLTSPIEPGDLISDESVVDFYAKAGWKRPEPASGSEMPDLSSAEDASAEDVARTVEPIENLTFDQIVDELHNLLSSNASSWVRVYALISRVRTEKMYSPEYRSFSAWIKAEAEREGVTEGLLWHRKSAGDFYLAWASEHPDAPGLSDGISGASEENLNLIRKIGTEDKERADELMHDLCNGKGLSTKSLRQEWREMKRQKCSNADESNSCKIVQCRTNEATRTITCADKSIYQAVVAAIKAAGFDIE